MLNHLFKIRSPFSPTGDQPEAIAKLVAGVKGGLKNQVLLGVTGSGKTFTLAHLIQKLQMPALLISHNKTLAGQLYQEMRDFFPDNAVSYYVSYYDYYQPEAYLPATDTYIEKEADINQLIDKLRLKSTTNILTRPDAIVVASVSCIYNIGAPENYSKFLLELKVGGDADWKKISRELATLQYNNSNFDFARGSFRTRGTHLDIYPSYDDCAYRVASVAGKITGILPIDPLTGEIIPRPKQNELVVYPAKQYLTDPATFLKAERQIRADLETEHAALVSAHRIGEASRLLRRVNYDLEMIKELGYVSGIENYSRYFDGRKPGDPPHSLLDYFQYAYGQNYLTIIDESHMTVPQLRGMYNGDAARKKNLIDFGFRLRASLDNRPLRFDEFYRQVPRIIYSSATPDAWELTQAQEDASQHKFQEHNGVVEQLVRPTGIVDPLITIRPAEGEIPDLVGEIEKRAKKHERVLVTALTKKSAEDLTQYLLEKKIRAQYLHSDVHTLERSDILDKLRGGEFDVLIGVNLLREGLDLPEVTLVAILDADREGFLRSRTSLIQTMGRAARNIEGRVILYADHMTNSMQAATQEINRRREIQLAYNKTNKISPKTIIKPIREKIIEKEELAALDAATGNVTTLSLPLILPQALTPLDKKRVIKKLEVEMKRQAQDLNFELAIQIRDKVRELKSN